MVRDRSAGVMPALVILEGKFVIWEDAGGDRQLHGPGRVGTDDGTAMGGD